MKGVDPVSKIGLWCLTEGSAWESMSAAGHLRTSCTKPTIFFFYLNTSQRKTTEQTEITKNDIFLWIWERSFLSESWPWPYDRKAACWHPWRRVINVAWSSSTTDEFFLWLIVYFVVIRWFGLLRNNAGRSAFTFIWKVTKLCRVEVVSLTVPSRTAKTCVFEQFRTPKMAAGLYAPRGVETAYERTGPVTRGKLCKVGRMALRARYQIINLHLHLHLFIGAPLRCAANKPLERIQDQLSTEFFVTWITKRL